MEEVESEAKKASEQIEKQGHHGFSFKRKKKADSKGTEQAETADDKSENKEYEQAGTKATKDSEVKESEKQAEKEEEDK